MMNYCLKISYDGTRFFGWERKDEKDTIQGRIENVLAKMCGQEVKLIGSGRTDAGVHATGMVANVHMEIDKTPDMIRDYINKYLPDDICISNVKEVSDRFHARYNAKGKTYVYSCYIGKNKPIFNRKYVYSLDFRPNIKAMQSAAKYMIGEHDFASFCTNSSKKKTTVRKVDKIDISYKKDELEIVFHGNGFLYNMVRIMTGTLLEVGKGKIMPKDIQNIIQLKNRSEAGPTAPAQGLRLENVEY